MLFVFLCRLTGNEDAVYVHVLKMKTLKKHDLQIVETFVQHFVIQMASLKTWKGQRSWLLSFAHHQDALEFGDML